MQEQKQRIAARFAAAAQDYDAASPVQRQAADLLAARASTLALPRKAWALEIGCGTGHLTGRLLPRIAAEWIVSDIAFSMARLCRVRHPQADYLVMDGESPALAANSLDLIVSNLALQWFADLPVALARLLDLLVPGGHLLFTTLGAGTFAEWQAAHAACGLHAATPNYPSAEELRNFFPPRGVPEVRETLLRDPAAAPLEFLRGLRAIGAHTPRPGVVPLAAGQLRRVLRALPAHAPQGVSYCLLTVCARKT